MRYAVTTVAAAVLLAGCGASRPATRHRPAARPAVRPLAITHPAPGSRVAVRPYGHGRRTGTVAIAGTAAPGQQITVGGECPPGDCNEVVFADVRGRWRTTFDFTAPAATRRLLVTAAYSAPRPGEHRVSRAVGLRPQRLPRTSAAPRPERVPEASPQHAPAPHTLIVVGDSLAVGMAKPLAAALPGWRVSTNGRIGRPLAEGMRILEATPPPPGGAVLAFSLFTNDSPTNLGALDAAVRESVARAGAGSCAIWATITRPPLNGVSYAAANDRLRALAEDPRLAGRLLLVPWAEEAAAHPEWMAPDHVHATPAGYEARASLYAEAAQSCGG